MPDDILPIDAAGSMSSGAAAGAALDPEMMQQVMAAAQAQAQNVPPPGGGIPAGIPQQAPPISQAPAQQAMQPPRPGGKPLLLDYIQNMIKGGRGQVQPGQAPERPQSRGDMTLNFMGQFLSNMAEGLKESGHGPGANLRGAAGAMQAPYGRAVQQYQMQQQQQAQQAQIASEQAKTQLTEAQAEQAKNVVMTPYGPMNQKLAEKVFPAAIAGGAKVTSAQIGQGMGVDVPKDLQEQFGVPAKMPIKQLNALESAANKPLTTVQGANDAFVVNKQTGAKTALGVGSGRLAMVMNRPVQVADPKNPGGVIYMPAGEAMRLGLPAASSANVTVPKGVMKEFTSGASAKTLNSFNTATEHLKLLSSLGDALDNGNIPLINTAANRVATATGGAAPTSFNMAKQAVAGEIAKTFKGQATEGEISAINSTLNNAQSPTQLKGAINTALSLMESKRAALMKQYDEGIKNQPAFPTSGNDGAMDRLSKKYLKP